MKKKAVFVFGIIIALMFTIMIFNNPGDHIPQDWPDMEQMSGSLSRRHYNLQISTDNIAVGGITLEGQRIIGKKGKDYAEAFWCKDESAVDIIEDYLKDTYRKGSYHRVNNTIYFGTEKALKDAGLSLREG